MAKLVPDNVGAQSQDGINAKVGIQYLNPNRTAMLLALQEDCPAEPEEMVIEGKDTYSIKNMFKKVQPAIEVSLKTGDETDPIQDAKIGFNSIKSFEPDDIMEAVPLLRGLKDKQDLIHRLEQLMQEAAFQKILKDPEKKQALVGFLRAVISDIEAVEEEE